MSQKRHISSFNDISIFYDKGSFDDWCVFISNPLKTYAPKDTEYFDRLQQIAKNRPPHQIYKDFVRIYNQTTTEISADTLELIKELSQKYKSDSNEIRKWFTVMYAGMVAEENKANKILGKRIKRLGIYQVLKLNRSPQHAANYGRGKKWQYLDDIMREYGF